MKSKILKTAILTLALSAVLAIPAFADTVGGGTVTADLLNLRSQPSTSSSIMRTIPQNTFVLVEEKLDGWYKICHNGAEGYVSASYLNFAETLDGWFGYGAEVKGTSVRMRSEPNTNCAVLGSYNTGDGMQVLGVSGNWVKVDSGSATGYIRSDYLVLNDAVKNDGSVTAAPQPAAQSMDASKLVDTAKNYLGVRYIYGGMSESGFDCSGFVNYVFNKHGVSMHRVAQDIYSNDGTYVAKENLAVGDLVFFGYSASNVTHVGMYIGNGQFIHASSGAGKVVITDLSSNYYTRMYVGAKRVF